MLRRRLLTPMAVLAGALALAACGGDDDGGGPGPTPDGAFIPNVPQPVPDDDNRFARRSSVGEGVATEPPAIAPAVRAAAMRAGCTVRAFPSLGRNHLPPDTQFSFTSNPPIAGDHYENWADWGVYDQQIPYAVQVHNLEHGGILVHVGRQVPAALREELGRFWAASPPFVMLMPDDGPEFPQRGVVVTAWQRWLVCKPYQEGDLQAIQVFRDTYRGTGPEGVSGLNSGVANDFPGMPAPLVPDVSARPGGG